MIHLTRFHGIREQRAAADVLSSFPYNEKDMTMSRCYLLNDMPRQTATNDSKGVDSYFRDALSPPLDECDRPGGCGWEWARDCFRAACGGGTTPPAGEEEEPATSSFCVPVEWAVRMWRASWARERAKNPHVEHRGGGTGGARVEDPPCTTICRSRFGFWWKAKPQMWHTCGRSCRWILATCRSLWCFRRKPIPHVSQWCNGADDESPDEDECFFCCTGGGGVDRGGCGKAGGLPDERTRDGGVRFRFATKDLNNAFDNSASTAGRLNDDGFCGGGGGGGDGGGMAFRCLTSEGDFLTSRGNLGRVSTIQLLGSPKLTCSSFKKLLTRASKT